MKSMGSRMSSEPLGIWGFGFGALGFRVYRVYTVYRVYRVQSLGFRGKVISALNGVTQSPENPIALN